MSYRRAKSLDKNLIFAEYFNSETEVRRNGGVPSNVTFARGVAEFNGGSSIITYQKSIKGTFSVRCIFSIDDETGYLIDTRGEPKDGSVGYVYIETGTSNIKMSSGTRYVNGVAAIPTTFNSWNDIVVTGITLDNSFDPRIFIGNTGTATTAVDGYIKLLEIYSGTLTAEEVANLYNDARYSIPVLEHEAQGDGTDLNVSSCENAVGANSYTSFSNASITGFSAVSDGSASHRAGTADEIVYTNGQRIIVEFDLTLNSGTAPSYYISRALTGANQTVEGEQVSSEGHNTFVFTMDDASTGVFMFLNNTTSTSYTISNLSVQNLSVEPTSKILHVSARDGVARNLLSGDTIGDVLNVSNCANSVANGYDTFDGASPNGFHVVSDGSALMVAFTADEIAYVSGKKYRVVFNLTLTSGTAPIYTFTRGDDVTNRTDEGYQTAIDGFNVFDFTLNDTSTGSVLFRNSSTATEYTISNLQVHEIIPEVTNTAIEVAKDGQIRVPRFEIGDTSKIDCGSYHDLTGDVTVLFWAKVNDVSGSDKYIFSNGEFYVRTDTVGYLRSTSNNSDVVTTNTNIVPEKEWFFYAMRRKSDGTIDGMFVNGVDTHNGGTVDSGTPVAGTSNILIGARPLAASWHHGDIAEVIVIDGLLTAEEISQYYTATKHLYGK